MTSRQKHKPKAVVADTSDSDCFSDLRWSNGVAYFTFARDGYQDSIEMDREEFDTWASDDLGRYYNANYR